MEIMSIFPGTQVWLILNLFTCFQLISILIITLFLIQKWRNNHYSSEKLNNLPPSPPKLPVIRNLHQLGLIPRRSLKSLADKYGPVMMLHLGSRPALVITSANAAEELLKKNDLAFSSRPGLEFVGRLLYGFKDMAFSPYGEHWRQIRGISVTQLLSNKRVQSFGKVRRDEIERMMETISESACSSTAVCLSDILATLSNNIVTRVAIGKRYSEDEHGSEFKELFEKCNTIGGSVNIADYIPWLWWINYINGMESKVKKLKLELDAFLESIVEEAIKRQATNGENNEQNFLDVLLQFQRDDATGSVLDRDSMKALIMNMVLGGTDTVSSLLEWTFSELIRSPNVMSKLQKEVRHHGDKTKMITEEDLEKLPYVRGTIREGLRMHPSARLLFRESREAVKVQGFDIAPKTIVFVNVWAIGRDPESWEEPDDFRPERFLGNNSVDIKGHHFQYLPFGYGRRICPGSGFALVTAELALANLIRKFNFELPGDVQLEELDMTEAHGMVNPRRNPLFLVPTLSSSLA